MLFYGSQAFNDGLLSFFFSFCINKLKDAFSPAMRPGRMTMIIDFWKPPCPAI